MIVGVEPLLHCKCLDVSLLSLVAPGHCKICIGRIESEFPVSHGNDIEKSCGIEQSVIE